jgi:hypothetical protein
VRLAIGLTVLWFVFWTFAYIISPRVSENAPLPPSLLSLPTDIVLVLVAALAGLWVVYGFRPNYRMTTVGRIEPRARLAYDRPAILGREK